MGKTWSKPKTDLDEKIHRKKASKHGHSHKYHSKEIEICKLRPQDLMKDEGQDPWEGDEIDFT